MGGGEVGKVGWLEWEMFERHRNRGGWGRESKEGDDGEDVWLCGRRRVWVSSGVDWVLTGETGGKRAKKDRDRSRLVKSLVNRRGLKVERRTFVGSSTKALT